MALPNVFMIDTDGNIGGDGVVSTERVSGMIFDISKQSTIWTTTVGAKVKAALDGTVVELFSADDLEELGLTPSDDVKNDFMFGIPYYHISHFFQACNNSGRLFVMFADCSTNWNAISQIQRAAHGTITQLGVYTEQNLWHYDGESSSYAIQLVSALNAKALELANENSPLSILLSAQSAAVSTDSDDLTTIDLSKIPTCIGSAPKVTVLLGQGTDNVVASMQLANTNHTPVGCLGAALGNVSVANVAESLAWVSRFNMNGYFSGIEMGFGDISIDSATSKLKSTLKYSALSKAQLDDLDNKGYVFLIEYAGLEGGIYFSRDRTCSDGDYRTIARNRTINKSRRGVRAALLPYVNAPLKIDPSTGYLSSAQITVFKNAVSNVLSQMVTNEEISGFLVTIPSTQNVLASDKVQISYKLIPMGTASEITVTEGFSVTNK